MKKTNPSNARCRNWTIVVYPDSAPDDWIDIIQSYHIEWIKSPLHDKDITGNGEFKKSHWHVLLMFGSVKSYEQVLEITQKLGCPIPQRVHNSKALVRYMLHLDDADKHQYDLKDLETYGGVDVAEMLRPSNSERYTLIKEMIDYIKDFDIIEFQDLLDYACVERFNDWFPLLCDNSAYVITQYIKSQRYRAHTDIRINQKTGEVL